MAVVEGGVVYYVRTEHIGRPVFATDGFGTKVWEDEARLGGASSGRPSAPNDLPFGGVHSSTGTVADLRFPPLVHLADALPGSGISGSSPNPACTRTGCATMTQQQGDTSRQTH